MVRLYKPNGPSCLGMIVIAVTASVGIFLSVWLGAVILGIGRVAPSSNSNQFCYPIIHHADGSTSQKCQPIPTSP